MRVARSEILSLMLSRRRRSTALWDSRLRRRFSLAIMALSSRRTSCRERGTCMDGEDQGRRYRDERPGCSRKDRIYALFRGQVVRRGFAALLHAHDAHPGHIHLFRTHAKTDAPETGPAVEGAEA